MKIKIYTSPICIECERAKKFFKDNNFKYQEVDVFENKTEAEKIFKKAGMKRIPIIQIDGKIFTGFDKKKIQEVLE